MAPAPETPAPAPPPCSIRLAEARAFRLFGGETTAAPDAAAQAVLAALDHPAVRARVVAIIHEATLRGLRL